jgi:hypothetical protein
MDQSAQSVLLQAYCRTYPPSDEGIATAKAVESPLARAVHQRRSRMIQESNNIHTTEVCTKRAYVKEKKGSVCVLEARQDVLINTPADKPQISHCCTRTRFSVSQFPIWVRCQTAEGDRQHRGAGREMKRQGPWGPKPDRGIGVRLEATFVESGMNHGDLCDCRCVR